MSRAEKIINILNGVITILFGILMFSSAGDAYRTVLVFLEIALILYGWRLIIYYLRMARHMVGGKVILYEGLILLDIGIFTLLIVDIPRIYAMLYLVVGLAVDGIVDLLRTYEIRKLESGNWKYQVSTGTVKIILSVICLFFLNSPFVLVSIYSLGLVHSGVGKIASALRPGAIVYISN